MPSGTERPPSSPYFRFRFLGKIESWESPGSPKELDKTVKNFHINSKRHRSIYLPKDDSKSLI